MLKRRITPVLDPFRIKDINTLIRNLATSDHPFLTHEALVQSFRSKPESAPTWLDIGRAHSDIFRMNGANTHMALLARANLAIVPTARVSDARPRLNEDEIERIQSQVAKFQEIAIGHLQRNGFKVPITAAIISGLVSISIAIGTAIHDSNKSDELKTKIDKLDSTIKEISEESKAPPVRFTPTDTTTSLKKKPSNSAASHRKL